MSPPTRPTAAIVGAGIAGLACARVLQDAGWQVTLFDKARGPGGRMTSRSLAAATVDIGAQFFSVRDEAFRREIEAWLKADLVAPWPWKLWRVTNDRWHYRHDGKERYAGKPRMSAVTRHLSRGAGPGGELSDRIAGAGQRSLVAPGSAQAVPRAIPPCRDHSTFAPGPGSGGTS